jgi:hypothetical protein
MLVKSFSSVISFASNEWYRKTISALGMPEQMSISLP